MSATPHTISSGWVEFELFSKVYSGNIDAYLGTEKNVFKAKAIELYNPQIRNITHSYSCDREDSYFNFTSNHFWCYSNLTTYLPNTTIIDESNIILNYNHSYEWGNLATKTAYWNETRLVDYEDLNLNFNTINKSYNGKDVWQYTTVNINANQTYKFRIYFENQDPYNSIKKKYDFAIKPSGETLQQSIDNGHFYMLDPWTIGLDVDLFAYYTCQDKLEQINDFNLTEIGSYNYTTGKIGNGCNSPSLDFGNWNITELSDDFKFLNNFTLNCWIDVNSQGETSTIMSNRQESTNNTHGWSLLYGTVSNKISFKGDGTLLTSVNTHSNAEGFIMVTARGNDTSLCLNIDSSDEVSCQAKGTINASANVGVRWMFRPNGGTKWNGLLDECGFWGKSLTDAELSSVFNSGNGLTRAELTDINVTLTDPVNNSRTSLNTFFNNSVDSLRLLSNISLWINSTGIWHKNQTNHYNSNQATTNFTLNITTQGNVIWNLEVCDDRANCIFNETNFTVRVDNINPTLVITAPNETVSSKTPEIKFTASDTNLDTCWFNITTLIDTTSEVVSFRQISNCTSDNVPSGQLANDIDYVIFGLVNDSAGNTIIDNETFTTPVAPAAGGGGGGGGGFTETVSTVVLIKSDNDTNIYTPLDRAKLYKVILRYCEENTLFGKCSKDEDLISNLSIELEEVFEVKVSVEKLNLWIDQFEGDLIESIEISKVDVEKWNLIAAQVIVTETDFKVTPFRFDRFFIALGDEFEDNVFSNRVLKSCEVIGGDVGFGCTISDTTAVISYTLPEGADFTFDTVQTTISYTDIDDNNVFQEVNLRVIRITFPLIASSLTVLFVGGLVFIRRKEIVKAIKKIQRR